MTSLKRVLIGGFLSLIGSVWGLAIVISANSYIINGWSKPPGKLLTQISESNLMAGFVISVALVVLGIVLMAVEFFRKNG